MTSLPPEITVVIEDAPAPIEVTVEATAGPVTVELAEVGLVGPIGPPDESTADALATHLIDPTPHPAYDDLPSLTLLFENGLV